MWEVVQPQGLWMWLRLRHIVLFFFFFSLDIDCFGGLVGRIRFQY